MVRSYLYDQDKIEFSFKQTKEDFIVDEMPLRFTSKGRFLILKVQKVMLSTWDMISVFARYLNIEQSKIGYGGLKDKYATTTQYISVEARHEKALKKFRYPKVKILQSFKHNKAIKMGDLLGNCFSINLYDLKENDFYRFEDRANKIVQNGLVNYFGYQRFGRDQDAISQAKAMVDGDIFISDKKLKRFLLSLYQSYYFNEWLNERVLLSNKQNGGEFLLLQGDVYTDETKKLFTPKKALYQELKDKKVVPTGLLCGRGVFRAFSKAREIEQKYDDPFFVEKGYRREAIIYPKNLKLNYTKKTQKLNISFCLPKGSYATVFLEAIANRILKV